MGDEEDCLSCGDFWILFALLRWGTSCCLVIVLVLSPGCLFIVYSLGVVLCLLFIHFARCICVQFGCLVCLSCIVLGGRLLFSFFPCGSILSYLVLLLCYLSLYRCYFSLMFVVIVVSCLQGYSGYHSLAFAMYYFYLYHVSAFVFAQALYS